MSTRIVTTLVSLALAAPVAMLAVPADAAPAVPSSKAATPYDVNGDGRAELVVGAPLLDVDGVEAGGVVVLPGTKKGLTLDEQVVTQSSPGVVGESKNADRFGDAVASGDFDRDGYADLAVGHVYESFRGAEFGGAVTVLYGSADGLTGQRSIELTEPGGAQADAGFGGALVAADLDGDGFVDLAVGAGYGDRVPFEDEDYDASGAVAVYRGAVGGISASRVSVLHGQQRKPAYDVHFGSSLAVGDLDEDGTTDLVVGSSGSGFDDGDGYPGTVNACYGGGTGPTSCARLTQVGALAGLMALAVGDVSGSDRPEVVVGVPDADHDNERGGAVQTLSLSGGRSSTTVRVSELTQDTKGVPGSDEQGDDFGSAVALGDLDRDGHDDLVVGSPGEAVGSREDAGRVTVVHGGTKGYRTTGNTILDQNTQRVPSKAERGDRFGSAVALLDHDGDGRLDLSVGAPGENGYDGAVTTLKGSGSSFTTKGSRTFGLATLGVRTPEEARFGSALGG